MKFHWKWMKKNFFIAAVLVKKLVNLATQVRVNMLFFLVTFPKLGMDSSSSASTRKWIPPYSTLEMIRWLYSTPF
ncbi:MAG: hypothetical protein KDD45_01465 [Bdellovibrionales bacterium]|nr:hypothetical protein [Bdellovibrionales bacterium]